MQKQRIGSSFLRWIVIVYSLFVFCWFLTNLFIQDSWWVLVGLDKFAEYFLLPAIPVFALALLLRQVIPLLLAVIPIVVAAFFYLPVVLPVGSPDKHVDNAVQNNVATLRVMTFNIWNHNKDIPAVVELINSINPDVVALQEITEEQKAELISLMEISFPHWHVSKPIYGGTTALFSRKPLSDVQELDFSIDRPAILADLNIEDRIYTVISAHLNPSFWAYHGKKLFEIPPAYHQYIKDQNKQAEMIIDAASNRDYAAGLFLACDCNSQETASTNRILGSFFQESFRAVGWQLGKPQEVALTYERRLNHIDYIWFRGDVEPMAVYRGTHGAGSDHSPVVTDFSLY